MSDFKTRESAISARDAMLRRENELAQLFKDASCLNNRNLVDPEKSDQAQAIFREFLQGHLASVGIVKKPKLVGANKNREKVVSRIEFTIAGERTRAHLGSFDTAEEAKSVRDAVESHSKEIRGRLMKMKGKHLKNAREDLVKTYIP